MIEHEDGNVDATKFVTLSAPEHDERQIVEGLLQVLAEVPDADPVSWAASFHDLPVLVYAAMKQGLTLPSGWKYNAWLLDAA